MSRSLASLTFCTVSLDSKAHILECNKKIWKLFQCGKVEDACNLFDSMPQRDSVTWNSMISGYSRNNRMMDAQALFDVCREKNVYIYTSMLCAYAKMGRISEALGLFEAMPNRNVVSYNAMISGFLHNGDVFSARKLFDRMVERNVPTWNSMVSGYCKCGYLDEARDLFDRMPERNEVSWVAMISGYVTMFENEKAWTLFLNMLRKSDVKLDQAILAVIFSSLADLDSVGSVMNLMSLVIKIGIDKNVVVGSAILYALTTNGSLDFAVKFFEGMEEKNEHSYTTMIAAFSRSERLEEAIVLYRQVSEQGVNLKNAMVTAYAENGRLNEARSLFSEVGKPYVITWNAMLTGYLQNGMVEDAKNLFEQMPKRNAVSWGAMISGLLQNGKSGAVLQVFSDLRRSGTIPGHPSLTSALVACSNCEDYLFGRQIHCLVIKVANQFNTYIGNGLISMYAKSKDMYASFLIFTSMRIRDAASWNSVISGFSKNNMMDYAVKNFEIMPKLNAVSWNCMLSAHVQAGEPEFACRLFLDMLTDGVHPSESTVTSLLSVCESLKLGRQIHAILFKLGFNSHLFVGNALIDMYFKFSPKDGFLVFECMEVQDLVTWNTVLTACGLNGFGEKALQVFQKMRAEGFIPDEVSFLGILRACSRAGLVAEGLACFSSMILNGKITPTIHHYTAVVDLLGKAGRLKEAESIINKMPFDPNAQILGSLLDACRIHHNMNLSHKVAERLRQIGAKLSNVHPSSDLEENGGKCSSQWTAQVAAN